MLGMESSSGVPYTRSSSHYKRDDDPVEDVVVLGPILSRKSRSNSLQRHLPFNNRWKNRYFVIERNEILSIISSGKRMNLFISRMTVGCHDYSPDSSFVLALSYFKGNKTQNIPNNPSTNNNITLPAFINTHTKELEIQLQFNNLDDMIQCKKSLLSAINLQKNQTAKMTEFAVQCIRTFLKKKLDEQVNFILFYFAITQHSL